MVKSIHELWFRKEYMWRVTTVTNQTSVKKEFDINTEKLA
jgi:hypothetical protein